MSNGYEPHFLLSTSSNLEGYRIIAQYGIVFGETFFKHGFLKSMSAAVSNTIDSFKFGSREMSGTTSLIEDARSYAYDKMIQAARARGANAIIAIDSDNTIGGELMYISLYGTAVKVVPEEDYEREKENQKRREEEKKAQREKDLADKKAKYEEQINKYKNNTDENGNVPDEAVFLLSLESATSVSEIMGNWIGSNLEGKYPNISSYLKMRMDSELNHKQTINIDKVKEVVQQLVEKELASTDN